MDTRSLSVEEARKLAPGSQHYRAFVGHPRSYDITGATQFSLMVSLGLREEHSLLDVGCGSLCGGRLFIPYLLAGNYCGIEPEAWLIEDGVRGEVSEQTVATKQPRFHVSDSFEFEAFGQQFDFIVSQSVLTHVSTEQLDRCLAQAAKVLKRDGLFAASFFHNGRDSSHDGPWVYPEFASFSPKFVTARAAMHGLTCVPLIVHSNYEHYWMIFAHRSRTKPTAWIGNADERSPIIQMLGLRRELQRANMALNKAKRRAKQPARIRPRDRLRKG